MKRSPKPKRVHNQARATPMCTVYKELALAAGSDKSKAYSPAAVDVSSLRKFLPK